MTTQRPVATAEFAAMAQRLSVLAAELRPKKLADELVQLEPPVVIAILEAAVHASAEQDVSAKVWMATWTAGRTAGDIAESFIFAWRLEAQKAGAAGALVALAPMQAGRLERDSRHSLAVEGVSLGHRRARARVAIGEELDRLVRDPDPEVVRRALENPRMTEVKVVRLAATRRLATGIMRAVLRSKFGRQPSVKRAVAMNPTTDPSLALPLLPALSRGELVDIAEDQAVSPAVRQAAGELL